MKTNLLNLSILNVIFFFSCVGNSVNEKGLETKISNSNINLNPSELIDTSVNNEKIQLRHSVLHTSISEFVSGTSKSYFDSIVPISEDFWRDFSKEINDDYSKIESKRLSKMSNWVDTSFISKSIDTCLVFYPFSGPDFLHANFLYPNANEYILMALEDVGSMPDWKNLGVRKTERYLENVNRFLRDIYLRSYFITKHMKLDIKEEEKISGVISSLYWFLAKTGHKIVDVKYVSIDTEGNIVVDNSSDDSKAVQFLFHNGDQFKIKKLTYISCDISDKGFTKKNPEIKKFLTKMRECNTFVKSASYLMHYRSFNMIRDIILEKSISLFQDDTGIPFKYMKSGNLSVQCFGKYVKPIKDFEHNNDILFQKDLELLYKKGSTKLPFSLGYHWRDANEQNQMLMTNNLKVKSINKQIKLKIEQDSIDKFRLDSILKVETTNDKYIVVGSFKKLFRAKMLSKKLKGKGYESVNVISHDNKHLVVFGPYNSRNIDKELNTIKLKLEENAWIFISPKS